MPNIVLSRIDERLIHGQVGVQWVGFAGANLVLVANDEVAEDLVQQNLMEMVLAEGIAVRFWTCLLYTSKVSQPSSGEKSANEKYCAELKMAEAVPRSFVGNQAATIRAFAGNDGASEKPSINRIKNMEIPAQASGNISTKPCRKVNSDQKKRL